MRSRHLEWERKLKTVEQYFGKAKWATGKIFGLRRHRYHCLPRSPNPSFTKRSGEEIPRPIKLSRCPAWLVLTGVTCDREKTDRSRPVPNPPGHTFLFRWTRRIGSAIGYDPGRAAHSYQCPLSVIRRRDVVQPSSLAGPIGVDQFPWSPWASFLHPRPRRPPPRPCPRPAWPPRSAWGWPKGAGRLNSNAGLSGNGRRTSPTWCGGRPVAARIRAGPRDAASASWPTWCSSKRPLETTLKKVILLSLHMCHP